MNVKKGYNLLHFILISFIIHGALITSTYYLYSQTYKQINENVFVVNLLDLTSKIYGGQIVSVVKDQRYHLRESLQSFSSGMSPETFISLNNPESNLASYLNLVKRKIDNVWNYPLSAQKAWLEGSLALQFSILKTGRIKQIKILRSSGYSELDNEALRALTLSSPFPPLPAQFQLSQLNILADFEYHIEHE